MTENLMEINSGPLSALGRYLYETMERLAPGDGSFVEWDELPQWQRDLYCISVEKLFDETDLVRRVWKLTHHDPIAGGLEERK
jgi:hypothetical protein